MSESSELFLGKYNRRSSFFVYLGDINPYNEVLKKISISVINDLVTDNRVHKVSVSLQEMGFEPVLVGRVLPESRNVERDYQTIRMKLIFRKGMLFYLEYNLRLFFLLRKEHPDIFLSNDLDTLLANFLASRLSRKPLVYDSHEYFTEVPELIGRPLVRSVWKGLERFLVPKVDAAYTVCESIASVYRDLYHVNFKVVRNLPVSSKFEKSAQIESESEKPKVILYQGALNLGRGIEAAIRSIQYLESAELWLVGDGDLTDQLKKLVEELSLEKKVRFLGRLPIDELFEVTCKADLGISLEEDLGLNYRYALPNKLFDYIQAEVPVLVSNLPEMKNVVEQYQIGLVADYRQPDELAGLIKVALFDEQKRQTWLRNLPIAARELCWENESIKLKAIFQDL